MTDQRELLDRLMDSAPDGSLAIASFAERMMDRAKRAEMDCRSYKAMAADAIHRMDNAIAENAAARAEAARITEGLALEYVRVPEWCTGSGSDQHSAMVAIRCVATRLGVYGQLDDKIEDLLPADRAALGEQT